MRVLALLVLVALPAGADVELGGRPALRLGAGYDDNLFLDAQPSGPNPAQIRADAIFDVQPSLLGWLDARGHLLVLGADYLERITLSNGDLRDANVALGWRSARFGPLTLSLFGRYEHWATTLYPEDTFDLGAVEPGVRFQLHDRVAVTAEYRFAARAYSADARLGQLDLDQRVHGALWVRAARWLHLEAGYTFVHIGSTDNGMDGQMLAQAAELERHRGELWAELTPLSWLTFTVSYAVAGQHLPHALFQHGMSGNIVSGARDDVIHWFEAALVTRPLAWLEIFARYQLVDSTSTDMSGVYRRNQFVGGVGLRWDFTRQITRPRPLLPEVTPAHAVTFRHRAPPGSRVEVAGDWNAWEPQPLVEKSSGMYEATYIIPPGRHEYTFRVDGNAAEPADAGAYVPDGFGGRSAVLNVE